MQEKILYTVEEIMELFKISKNTAYRLIKSEGFPHTYVGRRLYVRKTALENWLRQQEGKQWNF